MDNTKIICTKIAWLNKTITFRLFLLTHSLFLLKIIPNHLLMQYAEHNTHPPKTLSSVSAFCNYSAQVGR